ncbi:MAG: tRNA glutamyl-Q(34) synthetase GluQRS [Oscillospiraceae bacterium]|nr:tRNA glutamyl-Q(34) synthetase GluQRS [Oscillospiraceae bacterium]
MRSETRVVGRFAPSPSGRLHLGNLLSSLLAWLDVRSRGGVMLFRLEDLDPARSFSRFADLMADDLRWLGLDWDVGWTPGDTTYAQSHRTERYAAALSALEAQGLIYDCRCSRAERLAASAPHPGEEQPVGCTCRTHPKPDAGRPAAKKLWVPETTVRWTDGHFGAQTDTLRPGADDFIVRRSDGVFAYQLAVSVDDMEMGVTRVVRAQDLLSSTAKQITLIRLLGGTPPEYCHCPLLVDSQGRKLSKRAGDLSMEAFRERYTPEELTGILAKLAGLRDTASPVTARELIAEVDWAKIPTEPIAVPDSISYIK